MKFRSSGNSPQAAYQAGSFYTRVFGWDFSPFQGPEDFWPITQDLLAEWEAAAKSGVTPPSSERPVENTASALQAIAVVSLEEAGQRILNEGGKVLTAPLPVPGLGFLVYCQDGAGNSFAIIEASDSTTFDSAEDSADRQNETL